MEAAQIIAVLVGLAGMLAHFWKKKIREKSFPALKDYIKGHVGYTAAAVAVTVAGAFGLAPAELDWGNIQGVIAALSPAFLVGYSVDSAINKAVDQSGQ